MQALDVVVEFRAAVLPEFTVKPSSVYIGETEGVFKRLIQHGRDTNKDFWTKTIIIVSKDENLTKSHVRYLESRLISLAKVAGRASLTNDTQPEPASLPESDKADMEFFIEQVQMILPVLGVSLTQPRPSLIAIELETQTTASPFFVLEQLSLTARAREVNGEFVLLAGSTARKHGVASWTSYKKLRQQLVDAGKLIDGSQPDQLVTVEDISFSSPSAAGAVVLGRRNVNGRLDWKVEGSSATYQEWAEKRLPPGIRVEDEARS